MFTLLRPSMPLLIGMFLLMIGNGMQGTVLGVRGGLEDFGNLTMGLVASGYFLGFLIGAQIAPWLLRRVGHVRVFAALASLISAAMILYAAFVHPVAWILARIVVGLCYSGVYVVAESWLNESATNATRGRVLSAYLIVQMLGIIVAQALLNIADPAGYDLFILMSVAVSISVLPILLAAVPVPVFESTRSMSMRQLFKISPLGCVGTFFLGAIFACMFGMAAVYGTELGLSNAEISFYIGAIYLGGLLLQYPIGWFSDRMDRRTLIAIITAVGAFAAVLPALVEGSFWILIAAGFVVGGTANPLYSLLIAHTNDFLEHDEMAAASSGLIVLNGIGAAGTPILVGWLMDTAGPVSFPLSVTLLMAMVAAYAFYRMTVRPGTPVEETLPVAHIGPVASPVTGSFAQSAYAEQAEEDGKIGQGAVT